MERTRYPGIYRNGNRYVAVISFKEKGKRRQQWVTRDSVAAARDAKRELEERLAGGYRPPRGSTGALLAEWLEKGEWRAQTKKKYRLAVKNHLAVLMDVPLKDLSPEVIEDAGLPREALVVLSSALGWAVRRKRLVSNPCSAVERPRKRPKPPKVLDAGERQRLLEAVRGDRLEPATVLGFVGGLRIAEVCAVRWGDLDGDKLTVARSWWGETKSGRERSLVLPASAVATLRTWKRRQAEELLRIGVRQTSESPIVSTLAGTAMTPTWLGRQFGVFTQEHDFDASFHTLRHSCATWLLHSGVDVVTVARRLGHADPGLVLNVYGHATKDSDRDAAERLNEAMEAGR
jgi:integrase